MESEFYKSHICRICFEIPKESLVSPDCMHRFCKSCFERTLRSLNIKNVCPTCKRPIVTQRHLRADPQYDALLHMAHEYMKGTLYSILSQNRLTVLLYLHCSPRELSALVQRIGKVFQIMLYRDSLPETTGILLYFQDRLVYWNQNCFFLKIISAFHYTYSVSFENLSAEKNR